MPAPNESRARWYVVALGALALAGGGALAMEWLQKGAVPLPGDAAAGPAPDGSTGATGEAPSTGVAKAAVPDDGAERAGADGTEEPTPAPARELVAQLPPPVDAAVLASAGLPASAAADLVTAIADLQQVNATGAGSSRLRDRIALVLAVAPDLAAHIADRSVVVEVERRTAPVDTVTSAFERSTLDRRAPRMTMVVYGREHVLRVRITRAVGFDQLWQQVLEHR